MEFDGKLNKMKMELDEPELDEQEMMQLNGSIWCEAGIAMPKGDPQDTPQIEMRNNEFHLPNDECSSDFFKTTDSSSIIIQQTFHLPMMSDSEEAPSPVKGKQVVYLALSRKNNCDTSDKKQDAISMEPALRLNNRQTLSTRHEKHRKTQKRYKKMSRYLDMCIYCGDSYKDTVLYTHIMLHHKATAVRCKKEECNEYFFETLEQMEEHIKKGHKEDESTPKVKFLPFDLRPLKRADKDSAKGNAPSLLVPQPPCQVVPEPGKREMVTCNFCKGNIVSTKIDSHITHHHKGLAFKCMKCRSFFTSKFDLDFHHKSAHDPNTVGGQTAMCIYCSRRYTSKNTLYHHVKRKHLEEAIKCCFKGCGEMFKTRKELDAHFEKLHASKMLYKNLHCDACPYRASNKKLIKKHIIENHFPKTYACGFCPKSFATYLKVVYHKNTSHLSRRMCPHCSKWFQDHYFNGHLVNAICGMCKGQFPCSKALKKHETKCKKNQGLVCLKCNLYCENGFELRKHKFTCFFDVERFSRSITVKPLESLKKLH